jgi:two-component sensor histidine kinase
MVATRALFQVPQSADTEAELRRCIRDLLSLSSLPALWIKADASQIADSLAQLTVSILDADFACVILRNPQLEIMQCHERFISKPIDLARVRERCRSNSQFEIDHESGLLRAICLPIGRDVGSGLIALSRRSGFPNDSEQVLLRVAANQAAIAIQRWKSDTERKRAEERQGLLIAELDHRVKNILAQVTAVASSTSQGSRSIDEFLRSLDGRIQSMAIAHSLLSAAGWQSVSLNTLVGNELAPYAAGSNLAISGTDVLLNASETQAVARVLHELATNAAKYGALYNPAGRVSVHWDLKPIGAAANLTLVWRELGGPPVASEQPTGYGTNLIRNLIPHELGGTVDLAFAKEGVNCRIEIPIKPA